MAIDAVRRTVFAAVKEKKTTKREVSLPCLSFLCFPPRLSSGRASVDPLAVVVVGGGGSTSARRKRIN